MPAERAPLPPTTILLLRLYAHLLWWPLDAHSPSQLIKDVPELKSNTLHTRMDILEQAGLLVSTWEDARSHASIINRRRVYTLTPAGWAHAQQELRPLQLPDPLEPPAALFPSAKSKVSRQTGS